MSDYTPPIKLAQSRLQIDTTPDLDGDLEVYVYDGDHIAFLTRADQIALRDLLIKIHPLPAPAAVEWPDVTRETR